MNLTPHIHIYHQDCMEAMRQMPDHAFELAIVDPPYGINAPNQPMGNHPTRKGNGQYAGQSTTKRLNGGGGKLKNRILNLSEIDWDNKPPSKEYFNELFRVSKVQIIWGGNYFDLPPTRGIIAWDKMQPWTNFSQFEMAWTSCDLPARLFRYSNTGGANKERKIHPTQKPVALYKWLLINYAQPNWKILDTHGGSLSIAVACHDLGFEITAYETNEQYYLDACARVRRHVSQRRIFDPQVGLIPKQMGI